MNSKELTIPYIEGLGKAAGLDEFAGLLQDAAEKTGFGSASVGTVNWPDTFPFTPECTFIAGWCRKGIGVLYSVSGPDLRAKALSDNGRVWEDSCCEFFISDPNDGTYYNFEMNCIGTLLAAKRKSRENCTHFSEDKLRQVRRFASLERKEYDTCDGDYRWNVGMFIPFSLIDIDPDNLPEKLYANFYKCGDLTKHIHFLSWSPIDCPKPDFHRPDFFGTLTLDGAPKKDGKVARILFPVLLTLYFITVAFLCFGRFDSLQEAPQTFLGLPADKVVHFCLFFPFPLLAYGTFGRRLTGRWKPAIAIIGIFIIGCLIGAGTELGQGLTSYRSCDINDFRADALGMALSSMIALIIETTRHSTHR